MMTEEAIATLAAELNAQQARLQPIFSLLHDPADWKAPINCELPQGVTAEEACEAIEFFTATKACVYRAGNGTVRVGAVGYRMGPAGP